MTGGGFGGCVVALTRPGALEHGSVLQAVDGARLYNADECDLNEVDVNEQEHT
jgi:galactokinase